MKKRILIILIILHATTLFAEWPYQQKPTLGMQIDYSHPLTPNVGLWLMNEGTGNKICDISGNGNTGTLGGDTFWSAGKSGSALEFPGVTDYVDCGNSSLFNFNKTDGFSVSLWCKPDTVSGDHTPVGKSGAAWYVNIWNNDIDFYVNMSDTNINAYDAGSNDFEAGKWYHIVCTAQGGTGRTHINGIASTVDTGGVGTYNHSLASVVIGANNTTGQYDFDGLIDSVMIWNRALSASEIALLYREPFCFMAEDLPVSMMYQYAAEGQVIFIQMSAIPLFLIIGIVLLMRGKNVK